MRNSALSSRRRTPVLSVLFSAVLVAVAAWGEEPTSSTPSTSNPSPVLVLASVGLGSWEVKAPIPTARHGMAAAVVQNSSGQYLFYTIGGSNENNATMRRVEAYNAAADKWFRKANLPVDRVWATAATIGGKIYVVGGFNSNKVWTKTLYVYDPVSNTWTKKASMPVAGNQLISGAIAGRLYVYTGSFTEAPRLYRYKPSTNEWTRRADPPHDHSFGTGGVINDKLYLAWGRSDAVDVYDPVTNSWKTVRPETPDSECEDCKSFFMGGTVFRGQLYSIGGFNDDFELESVEAYDPITNNWIRKANMHKRRNDRPAAGTVKNAAGQSRIVVVGGSNDVDGTVSVTEMYQP
jgi:N-acetylneuraminic acid mutarotase